MKKIIFVFAAILFLSGCGTSQIVDNSSEVDSTNNETTQVESSDSESTTTEDSTLDTESNIIEGTDVISDEIALEAFKELFHNLLTYASAGKKDEFSALCRISADDTSSIDKQYNKFQEYAQNQYDDYSYGVIVGDGTYFYCEVLNSIYSGTYPGTKYIYKIANRVVSYVDNSWKLDLTSEADTKISSVLVDIIPQQYFSAFDAGRNVADMTNNDYSWACTNLVINGVLDCRIYLAWQNEDASVSYLVNIKNGTSDIRSISNIKITFASTDLNTTIAEGTYNIEQFLAPDTSANYIITVPASEIMTGDSPWGAVTYSCDCRSN